MMFSRNFVPFALLSLVVGCAVAPSDEETSSVSSALDDTIVPGGGYDLVRDGAAGNCTESTAGLRPTGAQLANTGGQVTEFSFQQIDSTSKLKESMNLSASVSVKALVGGVDAKFRFASETDMSEESVYVLATVRIVNSPWITEPLRLTSEATSILAAKNNARFRERCGDGYVAAYRTGGEFYGVMEIKSSSKQDKQTIESSLSGSYGVVSGSASFLNSIDKISTNRNIKIRTVQIGGQGASSNTCLDLDCLKTRVREMPTHVQAHPVVVDATIRPYTTLALPGDGANPIDTQNAREIQEEIVAMRFEQQDIVSRTRNALQNPGAYEPFDAVALQNRQNTARKNLTALRSAASTCFNDFKACTVPVLEWVDPKMPGLRNACAPNTTRTRDDGRYVCTDKCDSEGNWQFASGFSCVLKQGPRFPGGLFGR